MNKSFGFLGLGILALLVLVSFASATLTSNPTSLTFKYTGDVESLIITSNSSTSTTITLPTQVTNGNKQVATLSYYSDAAAAHPITSVSVSSSSPQTIYVQATPDTSYFMLGGNLVLTDSASNTVSIPVSFQGNLEINIDSTKVLNGFGSDQSWYPLDNIEAKINVQNNGNDTIRSITVKWMVYDETKQKKILSGSESSFSLNDGDDKTLTVDFQLGSDVIDNLKSGDTYVFYAWASGKDESITNNPTTYTSTDTSKSGLDGLSINIDDNFVVVDPASIQTGTVACGNSVQMTATVWNIGDTDEDGVYLKVFNTDLGISERVNIGSIDSLTSKDISFSFDIPNNAQQQTYDLTIQVYDDNNNLFENSNNDRAQVIFPLAVTGACSNLPPATVTANLQSSAVAGQELDIAATITNTASTSQTFTLDLSGYSNWASLISIDKTSLSLNAGQSQTVLIKLQVNSGISGDQTMNLAVKQGAQTLNQPISVTVESPSAGSIFSGLGNNAYLWGIAALNIILVLVIIIVAVRVVRKK